MNKGSFLKVNQYKGKSLSYLAESMLKGLF